MYVCMDLSTTYVLTYLPTYLPLSLNIHLAMCVPLYLWASIYVASQLGKVITLPWMVKLTPPPCLSPPFPGLTYLL